MDPSKAENSNMVKFITFDVAPVFILVLKVLFFFAALASRRRFGVCVFDVRRSSISILV